MDIMTFKTAQAIKITVVAIILRRWRGGMEKVSHQRWIHKREQMELEDIADTYNSKKHWVYGINKG
jgi:hypothetical protein